MRKTLLIISFLTCLSVSSIIDAQSFEDIIASRRAVDCRDVTYNALDIISSLYTQNETDSLYKFLNFWESKCGGRSYILEHCFKIFDLKTGKTNLDSISEMDIELLISFREVINNERFWYRWRYSNNRENTEEKAFYNYLGTIARNSNSNFNDGNKILKFYAMQEPSFNLIKESSDTSKLKIQYDELYAETEKIPQFHWGLVTGFIHHFQDLSLFGTRPTFGFVFGYKKLKHNYDIILDFRAGDSPNNYSTIYEDELVTTKDYTGMYMGVEYAYDIYYSRKFDVSISPGIGWDRITALCMDNEYGEDPKFINSFNYNGGLVFKYKYGKRGGYLGLHARYNWANYDNKGGTKLAGQYFNLRLVWGNIFNAYRDHRLKMLE